MRGDETLAAVFFAKLRLLDLARGIARHDVENEFLRTFVSREGLAEFHEGFLVRFATRFDFDNRDGDFSKARVWESNNGDVLDIVVTTEKIFNLNGIKIFAPRDDDVLLSVDQINESVFVLAGHVAREEPSVR